MNIVIIGGARGIGSSIAELISRNPAFKAFVICRSRVESSRRLKNVMYIQGDICDSEDLASSIECIPKAEPLSLVFCQRYRGNSYAEELETMISAPIRLIHRVEDRLDNKSRLVFLGSVAGSHVISNQSHLYHAVRSGIEGLVRSLSVTYGERGIKCFCVRTTTIIKPENAHYFESSPSDKQLIASRSPSRQMTTSIDVAEVVLSLILANFPSVLTVTVDVDGGAGLVYQGL